VVVDGGRTVSGMEVLLVLAIWIMRKLEKGSFEKYEFKATLIPRKI
jgi:hypothetical protein